MFVAQWTTRGWRVVADHRPKDPYVDVMNSAGYELDLATTVDDGAYLSIGGSSPCAYPAPSPSDSL